MPTQIQMSVIGGDVEGVEDLQIVPAGATVEEFLLFAIKKRFETDRATLVFVNFSWFGSCLCLIALALLPGSLMWLHSSAAVDDLLQFPVDE